MTADYIMVTVGCINYRLVNWPIWAIKRRRERPGRTCIQMLIPEDFSLFWHVALTFSDILNSCRNKLNSQSRNNHSQARHLLPMDKQIKHLQRNLILSACLFNIKKGIKRFVHHRVKTRKHFDSIFLFIFMFDFSIFQWNLNY